MNNNRTWTKWTDKRTPMDDRVYRFRVFAKILGMDMYVEWSENQRLCGMGYSDSQYWPMSPCYWDGYRRYITNKTLEWSELLDGEPKELKSDNAVFHGLNLLPCPFTGKAPVVTWYGRYIGSAPYELESIGVKSYIVNYSSRDCSNLMETWNKRT